MAAGDVSLDSFAATIRQDIDKYVAAYRAKHEANPEQYPIVLPENNSGLWYEFFIDFAINGTV